MIKRPLKIKIENPCLSANWTMRFIHEIDIYVLKTHCKVKNEESSLNRMNKFCKSGLCHCSFHLCIFVATLRLPLFCINIIEYTFFSLNVF